MRAALLAALLAARAAGAPVLSLPRHKPTVPRYNTTAKIVRGAINVHIVPHAHLDLGWLKTFDEYLAGFNNTIQVAGVAWTYQSVYQALERNADRRFISVEMGFLMRWLDTQTADVVAAVKALVAADRLQLINAGWAMHDEATVTWGDAIDQMTLGHRLANETFGPAAASRTSWQIDPFGHSASQGAFFSAGVGHSSMFFGRLDTQEQAWRQANNATEYVWRPSRSLGASAQIFAGINAHGYDPPTYNGQPVFEWDVTSDVAGGPALLLGPLQPYTNVDRYNVPQYIDVMVALARAQAAYTLPDADGTVHVKMEFGTDFKYQAAEHWFSQIDGLIHFVNTNQTAVNLLYSTPRDYAEAKMGQQTAWPLKAAATPDGLSTDQLPYINTPHWQWSGYYSSRPALKGYVRSCSALFAAARQMQAFTGGAPADSLGPSNPLFALERALATSQHHDAVTGTARQHVTYDYAASLSAGVADAEQLLAAALSALTGFAAPYSLCPLANATICAPLEAARAGDPPTLIVLWNAAAQPRAAAPVRLPVALLPGTASFRVTDSGGAADITAQLLPPSATDTELREDYYGAPSTPMSWLAFQVPSIPPMGFAVVFITPVAAAAAAPATHASTVTRLLRGADETVTNGVVTLTLDGATGLVSAFADARSGAAAPLAQAAFYYKASRGCPLPPLRCDIPNDGTGLNSYGQSSTTYILRPNSSEHFPIGDVAVDVVRGPVVSEVRQAWAGGWLSAALRLWANASDVEAEHTVGPVPLADGWGKEVGVSWALGDWSAGEPPTFYSDSQGLERQKRVLNARSFPSNASLYEPVAFNYFPVTTRASLLDAATGRRFTLAIDRATGCASLAAGAIECLLHRRHLNTTFLGMGEVLNEAGLDATGKGLIARVSHVLRLDSAATAAAGGAAAALGRVLPLTTALAPLPAGATPAAWAAAHTGTFAGLRAPLAPQLHVLTAQSLGGSTLLVRVQHLFEAGEDAALSRNASVALGPLFSAFTVTAVVETTLSASLPLADVKPWTLRVQGEAEPVTLPIVRPAPAAPLFTVELAPQEIRTFVVTLGARE